MNNTTTITTMTNLSYFDYYHDQNDEEFESNDLKAGIITLTSVFVGLVALALLYRYIKRKYQSYLLVKEWEHHKTSSATKSRLIDPWTAEEEVEEEENTV